MTELNLNIVIGSGLLVVNLIFFLIYRYRKRKYGIYPTFVLAFITVFYFFYLIIPFKNTIDRKEQLYKQQLLSQKEETGAIYHDLGIEERKIEKHLFNLDKIARAGSIQSLLAILFSLVGLITYDSRKSFYLKTLTLSTCFFLGFATLELTEHLTSILF